MSAKNKSIPSETVPNMTNFTPNDLQVQEAYVSGMRTAFIASAGEHREEFERWISHHDRQVRAVGSQQIAETIAEYVRSEGRPDIADLIESLVREARTNNELPR